MPLTEFKTSSFTSSYHSASFLMSFKPLHFKKFLLIFLCHLRPDYTHALQSYIKKTHSFGRSFQLWKGGVHTAGNISLSIAKNKQIIDISDRIVCCSLVLAPSVYKHKIGIKSPRVSKNVFNSHA